MDNAAAFQHPGTGMTVCVAYRFGRISVEVEGLDYYRSLDPDASEAQTFQLGLLISETQRLVAPYQRRRCYSTHEAEEALREMSSGDVSHFDRRAR